MQKLLAKLKNAVLWQCVAIVIVTVIIIVEICVLASDMPKRALQESAFDNVKVVAYSQVATLGETEDDEEDTTTSAQEESEENETWVKLPGKREIGTMTVADGITYNDTDFGKAYFVTEDKVDYVISYVDDDLWDDSDLGHWEKFTSEEVSVDRLFDFKTIIGLTKKDFEKQGDAYILKIDENRKLCEILQTTQNEKYISDYLKFYFEDGRLSSIRMGCYYGDNMYVAYEYHFTYGDYSLELPEIQQ